MGKQRDVPDWEQFEKWMGEKLPFMPDKYASQRRNNGGDWIGQYVQDVLRHSFAEGGLGTSGVKNGDSPEVSSADGSNELHYEYETFETHNSVIARVTLPKDIHIRNVRVYAGAMALKLEQDPARKKMYIRLPAAVDSSAVKAAYKDNVLEIRCPRLNEAELYQEIRIRQL